MEILAVNAIAYRYVVAGKAWLSAAPQMLAQLRFLGR
jgi:hypothetical protein